MVDTSSVTIQMPDKEAKHYEIFFQTDEQHVRAWQSVLKQARQSKAIVTCGCSGKGEKRLAIRCYNLDFYDLARYPNSGDQHEVSCRFYALNPERSGLCCYQKGVIEECTDGYRIRLPGLMPHRVPHTLKDHDIKPGVRTHGRRSQPVMQLLGLLHTLWDIARLNVWWPPMAGKRSLNIINRELNKAAMQVRANRITLGTILLLPSFGAENDWTKMNRERIAIGRNSRRLVIAPLAKSNSNHASMSMLKIFGFDGIPFMNMDSSIWNRACHSFPRAITAWQNNQQRVMVIALIEIKSSKRSEVIDLALMPVTENWIPFDSQYEKMIADKLVNEGRAFIKPLRYDADDSVVFPDFILRDTDKEIPLEVFGRTDESYVTRKAEKTIYYEAEYGTGNWWCWNAADDPEGMNIPPFPPHVQR